MVCIALQGPAAHHQVEEAAAADEWLGLERELAYLALTGREPYWVDPERQPARLIGEFQFVGRASSGEAFEDMDGFALEQVKLGVQGRTGPFDYKIQVQMNGGSAELSTARARVTFDSGLQVSFGNDKAPFLWSGLVPRREVVTIDRTLLGELWSQRDLGMRLEGELARLRWALGAQNGGDGFEDELLWAGRLEHTLVGAGEVGSEEPPAEEAETTFVVGFGFVDEGTLDDGRIFALDLAGVSGHWFWQAEVADFGSDFTDGAVSEGLAQRSAGLADTRPADATLAYRLCQDWAVAGRLEFLDQQSTWGGVLGLNRYMWDGFKWQLALRQRASDDPDQRGGQLALGMYWDF